MNKQGGIRSKPVSLLATSIRERCLESGLQRRARHIPGRDNVTWIGRPADFTRKTCGKCPQQHFRGSMPGGESHYVDLFIDRSRALLPHFVSWKLDPSAMATDTMIISWKRFEKSYFNPPWNMAQARLPDICSEKFNRRRLWFRSMIALKNLVFDTPAKQPLHR